MSSILEEILTTNTPVIIDMGVTKAPKDLVSHRGAAALDASVAPRYRSLDAWRGLACIMVII